MPRRRGNNRAPYTSFLNQRNKKLATPRANFSMVKYYYVNMPTAVTPAPQDAAVLRIDCATPFNPITAVSGTWTAQDTNQEPYGISGDPYPSYNTCVVLGCKVIAKVEDSIDNTASGNESQHEGVVRLSRTAKSTTIVAGTLNSELRERSYSKGRAFQLAKTSVQGLMRNASLQMGYSARKQFNCDPVCNKDLHVTNTSGSSNTCTNPTYISLSVHNTDESLDLKTLKPFKVQLKLIYSVAFMDPGDGLNIPRPIPYRGPTSRRPRAPIQTLRRYGTANVRGDPSLAAKADYIAKWIAGAVAYNYAKRGAGRYQRYRRQYNR